MTDEMRERIARLVYPEAFHTVLQWMDHLYLSREEAEWEVEKWEVSRNRCYRTADAILDLIAERLAGVEGERDALNAIASETYARLRENIAEAEARATAAEAKARELETEVLNAAFSDRYDDVGAPITWKEIAQAAEAERDAALAKLEEAREVVRPFAEAKCRAIAFAPHDEDPRLLFAAWTEKQLRLEDFRAARAFIGSGS